MHTEANHGATQLRLEELEARDLLAAIGDINGVDIFGTANGAFNSPTATTNIVPALPRSDAMTPALYAAVVAANTNALLGNTEMNFTTSLGQITSTNGANTPGIGSFATATNGFYSRAGGTGGPVSPDLQEDLKQPETSMLPVDDAFAALDDRFDAVFELIGRGEKL